MCRNIKKSLQGHGVSKQFATITGWSKDKCLMLSWRGQLSLVPVNVPATGSMPLGPPQNGYCLCLHWNAKTGCKHRSGDRSLKILRYIRIVAARSCPTIA